MLLFFLSCAGAKLMDCNGIVLEKLWMAVIKLGVIFIINIKCPEKSVFIFKVFEFYFYIYYW